MQDRLEEYCIRIHLTDAVQELLADEGYDPQFGARPLRRAIQRLIEDELSEGLLAGRFSDGDTILVDKDEEGLTFEPIAMQAVEALP